MLGYLLGGESIGMRTGLGTFLILTSVIIITTTPAKSKVTARGDATKGTADLSSAEAD